MCIKFIQIDIHVVCKSIHTNKSMLLKVMKQQTCNTIYYNVRLCSQAYIQSNTLLLSSVQVMDTGICVHNRHEIYGYNDAWTNGME